MKLMLLGDAGSIHLKKWAISLVENGIDILICGLNPYEKSDYPDLPNLNIVSLGLPRGITYNNLGNIINYLRVIPKLKRIYAQFNPDIVHAHYASSYGLLGTFLNHHPFFISVWGSDVFDFPNEGFIKKKLLEYNLKKADIILSTSHIMAKETKKHTTKEIEVIPFGVDLDVFKPQKTESIFNENDIVIGTVKTLEEKYGIEYLIKAFKIIIDKHYNIPLKLMIVGEGSQEKYLKNLVKKLNIEDQTIFTGRINWNEVPKYHNMLSVSVSVSVSESESFGVAIVEAMACGKPVVVSNVGGLPEVVEDGTTGLVVPSRDPENTAKAIEKLLLDKQLRKTFGNNGRNRVEQIYNWNDCVKKKIDAYNKVL